MKFDFNDIKNKDNLLKRYSEEEIMEMMGVPIEERRFCSPFRDDRTPTCSLWRSPKNDVLYYMDWAVFNRPVDVFGLYEYLYNCTFTEALDGMWAMFEREFSSKPSTKPAIVIDVRAINETRITATSRNWTPKDLRWWEHFGVRRVELDKFHVQPVQTAALGDRIIYQHSSPQILSAYMYTFSDKLKVYFPHREYNRFYQDDGKLIQGWDQLPETGELVVITKSLKDIMLLFRLCIPAVAPQSESIIMDDNSLEELKSRFTNVVVLFDNDRVGLLALHKYKNRGVRTFALLRMWKAKDITDFYAKYGFDKTSRLIASFKEYFLSGGTQSFNFKL